MVCIKTFNGGQHIAVGQQRVRSISALFLGEKLSKQQLQHSNIIKKLRVKEKDSDTRIVKQTKQLKEQEEELKHLQQVGKEDDACFFRFGVFMQTL